MAVVIDLPDWRVTQPATTAAEPVWSRWLAAKYQGLPEYRTVDGSRVDVLTDEYAIEVEWAKKWPEAIGQALLYGVVTGRRPAVILLLRDKPSEDKYFLRCATACAAAGITLWTERTLSGQVPAA